MASTQAEQIVWEDVKINWERASKVVNGIVEELERLKYQHPEVAALAEPIRTYLVSSIQNCGRMRQESTAVKTLGEAVEMSSRFLSIPVLQAEETERQRNEDYRKKRRAELSAQGKSLKEIDDTVEKEVRKMPSVHDGVYATLHKNLKGFAKVIKGEE
jgi:hypothetical protein